MIKLEIVRLKGKKFSEGTVTCECTGGFGLFAEGYGYLSFKASNERKGVKSPYSNKKKVLQTIIDGGGLVHYNDIDWLQPTN